MIPKNFLGKVAVFFAVAFIFMPFLFVGHAELLKSFGYFGFFLASYFGAAGYLLLPFFLESLNPVLLTVIGAFGLSIDEFFAWYAGKTSEHGYKSEKKLYERVRVFVEKRGLYAIFCLGLLPLPGIIYAISGYTAGHFNIPFHRYFLANFSGKLIRTSVVVFVVWMVMK